MKYLWLVAFLVLFAPSGKAQVATNDTTVAYYNRLRIPMTISPGWRVLWRELEQCTGLKRSIDRTKFYVISTDRKTISVRDFVTPIAGYWLMDDHSITYLEPLLFNIGIVKHEMLHALMNDGAHPVDVFAKCKVPIYYDPRSN